MLNILVEHSSKLNTFGEGAAWQVEFCKSVLSDSGSQHVICLVHLDSACGWRGRGWSYWLRVVGGESGPCLQGVEEQPRLRMTMCCCGCWGECAQLGWHELAVYLPKGLIAETHKRRTLVMFVLEVSAALKDSEGWGSFPSQEGKGWCLRTSVKTSCKGVEGLSPVRHPGPRKGQSEKDVRQPHPLAVAGLGRKDVKLWHLLSGK